jgi:AcrR family transcriptional regulator
VNEIAEAADVSKATLFTYFPSKEALVLQGVGDDDLAGIVAGREPGQSPVQALRVHYRAFAEGPVPDLEDVVTRMQMIFASPALSGAANALLYQQRQALKQVLAEDYGEQAAALMAAQIAATVLTLQESFFHQLAAGIDPTLDVDLAFDLLEHGHPKGS